MQGSALELSVCQNCPGAKEGPKEAVWGLACSNTGMGFLQEEQLWLLLPSSDCAALLNANATATAHMNLFSLFFFHKNLFLKIQYVGDGSNISMK